MRIPPSLTEVMNSPTPDDLWRLRGDLLASGVPLESDTCALIGSFHDYVSRLVTGSASRDHSQLASKLDISAVSGVIIERLAATSEPSERALGLLSGAISEGLMALATRQHVHAWERELDAVHREAAWSLYEQLWRWTADRTPDLEPAHRRRLLDELFEPILEPESSGFVKAVLLGRLYQVAIASLVVDALK
jgi:hypothetical protein